VAQNAEVAASGRLTDHISLGVLASSVPRDAVDEAVAGAGRQAKRSDGRLPPHVMVYFAMALALFADDDYEEVAVRLTETLAWWGCWDSQWAAPTSGGLTQARQRLGYEPVRDLFATVAVPVADQLTRGAFLGNWRLMAIDGFEWDAPATKENAAAFGYAGAAEDRSAFPKVRVVSVSECASHAVVDAEMGPVAGKGAGEQSLARRLYRRLEADWLLIADRNLCATRRFVAFPAQPGGIGGQFLDPMAYPASKEVRGREHASKPMAVSRRTERRVGGSA
jgi:transposase IS4-like protein